LTRGDGLIIGREIKPSGKLGGLLRDNGPAHLLTLAPTRSGKGVGAIMPNAPSSASTRKARTRA
jgi:type IV secretion system protein VirD4